MFVCDQTHRARPKQGNEQTPALCSGPGGHAVTSNVQPLRVEEGNEKFTEREGRYLPRKESYSEK